MKVYRTPTAIFLTLYLPFFVIYAALYFFEYQHLLALRTVHWLFLAMALYLLISPQRNAKTSANQKILKGPLWFLTITGFVSLICAFIYLSQLFLGQVLIINPPKTQSLPTYFSQLHNNGLFPWGLVSLFAITLQRVYEHEKSWGYFSQCLLPIFNSEVLSEIGKYSNTTFRYPLLLSLSSTLIFIGLAAIYLFIHFSAIQISSGISLLTLFTSSTLFYAVTFTKWPNYFNWLIQKRVPFLLSLILMLIFGCAILAVPTAMIPILTDQPPIKVDYFNPEAWPLFWDIVSMFIALSWVPLTSAIIAVVSQGYSVWQIIGATLCIPFFLSVSGDWEAPTHGPTIAISLIICSLILLFFFFRPRIIAYIWRGLFPTAAPVKHAHPVAYLRSLLITSVVLIGIYWVTDVYLFGLIFCAYSISANLMIILATGYWTLIGCKENRKEFLPDQELPPVI